MYEANGFILHFFSMEKIEHIAKGFEIVGIEECEEGNPPRKLFRASM